MLSQKQYERKIITIETQIARRREKIDRLRQECAELRTRRQELTREKQLVKSGQLSA